MPKVSIVMPSLNVADYICECMDSVVNQSLNDIEIICIDAGSNDGTYEALEEYAKKDSRIQIIQSKRKSYGYQVNCGIKKAKGEYIGIVETDDFVEPFMYEELYENAKDNDLDCVKGDYWYITGKKGKYIKEKKYALKENVEFYNRVLEGDIKLFFNGYMYTWAGIYRRNYLIKNNIFHNETEGASYQDNGFWFLSMVYAHRVMFVRKAYYNLRRDNPTSSFFSDSKIHAIHDEYDYIHKRIERDDHIANKAELFKYCFIYRLKNHIGRLNMVSDENVEKCYRVIEADVRKADSLHEIDFDMMDLKLERFVKYLLMENIPLRYKDFYV